MICKPRYNRLRLSAYLEFWVVYYGIFKMRFKIDNTLEIFHLKRQKISLRSLDQKGCEQLNNLH